MSFVMGIDGGGTKTNAVIADMDGRIIAHATGGPTNPNAVPWQELENTLTTMTNELKTQQPAAFGNITSLFAGMSGAANDKMQIKLKKFFKKVMPNGVRICVDADTINALYSGTYGEPGIVQISGTGSITYGINTKSEHDRVGGWGYLFGDEGSGYDIGRQGIVAALKSQDGRLPETMLLQMLRSHFNVTNEHELVQKIYAMPSPKAGISPVSEIVFQAYIKNDHAARQIITDAAKEISLSIKSLYTKHFKTNAEVKAVLCGGIFNDKAIMPQLLEYELQDYQNINLITPEISPVGGSVIGACLLQQKHINQNVIQNIISTL